MRLADWFASARRVATLDLFFDNLDELAIAAEEKMIDLAFSDDGALHLCGLSIAQHDGTLMLADTDAVIERGEKVLVKGESGAGKSTLIRAIAGLWPWGSGRILRPRDARIAYMPQQPYMPRGTLRDALDYPHDEAPPDPAHIEKILAACGLAHLLSRLDEEQSWSDVLSGGEQQQLGFARVLLKPPDIIIMDEPTSALDDLSRTRLMELLNEGRLARPSSMPHAATWTSASTTERFSSRRGLPQKLMELLIFDGRCHPMHCRASANSLTARMSESLLPTATIH
ncbi:ATP-binding cassette domain-containing protein [Methylocystis sp. S23]